MKKFLLLLFIPVFTQAQTTATAGFSITGNIKGLRDSTMVYLAQPGDQTQMLATAYAKGGKFYLFGNVASPDVFQLNFIGYNDAIELFVNTDKFVITGDAKKLKQAVVAGSPTHNDYAAYQLKFLPLKEKLNALAGSINATQPGLKRDSLIGQFETSKAKVLTQVNQFVKAKPASPVSPYVMYLTSPLSTNIAALEEQFNVLKPAAKQGPYAQALVSMINSSKIGLVGTQSVDFTQNDTAGKPVSLSSFKGKYVLVDFWASWCRPCRMENPAVVTAFNDYKDKNFTVLGVSLDQTKESWLQAIKADNLSWTHVSDLKYWNNEAAQLYGIKGIPANMLLDPNGKIIARNLRGEDLQATLKQLLK